MAKLVFLWHALRVVTLLVKRKGYLYYGDFLVYLHFRYTSRYATDDSLREMLLERIRFYQRKNEQRTYTLWAKAFTIAVDKMGVELVNPHKNARLATEDDLFEDVGEN